jgi:hypothetical protein
MVLLTAAASVPALSIGAQSISAQPSGASAAGTRYGHLVYSTELNLGAKAGFGDSFGSAVALSADGRTAIVGVSRRTENGQTDAGAAEVYRFDGRNWRPPTELSLGPGVGGKNGARPGDLLGSSVALSADGNTALVGAPNRAVDGPGQLEGAAEVFRFGGGKWSVPTELSLGSLARGTHGNQNGDYFGSSLALSSDGNIALIGAPFRAVNGTATAGAAYIYWFGGSTWGQPAELDLGTRARTGDAFGLHLDLSGDGNVAVIESANRYNFRGAAEVFRFIADKWSAPTELSGQPNSCCFGDSVALTADGNTMLVTGSGPGYKGFHAKIFSFKSGLWVASQKIDFPPTDPLVASPARLSRDGNAILTGNVLPGPSNAGAAEEYRSWDGVWSEPNGLTPPIRHDNDLFAGGLALNHDGSVALIGAAGRSVNGKACRDVPVQGLVCPGAAEVFVFDPTAVAVKVNASSAIGAPIDLNNLSPDNPIVSYNPDAAASHMVGRLACTTNATPYSAPAGSGILPYYIEGCRGLSEPGHRLVYDYANSSYSIEPGPAVTVSVFVSGDYGSTPDLSNLPPGDPRIYYSPASEAANVTGTLTCATNATNASPAGFYDVSDCKGLTDSRFPVVYDYTGSAYLVRPAPVTLSYTGPTSIKSGTNVTLSARLTTKNGHPISGRVLRVQIGRGGYTQNCVTPETDASGAGSCAIENLRAWKSPNPARVWFDGDAQNPSYDYAAAYKRTPVSVIP